MIGAILTQATNWHNVEQALARLRAARMLTARALAGVPRGRLERLVRPSGFFRQKAARVQAFSRWYVRRYGGSRTRMFRGEPERLRRELLSLPGIGPETADAILLYAGRQPVVVVDAYARRVFRRHHLLDGGESYEQIQRMVSDRMPLSPALCNELHALVVAVGKRYCHRRNPACPQCPLGDFPHQQE